MTQALETAVARIETKLDTALAALADHETRLRDAERSRWQRTGAASLIGGLVATLGTVRLH